MRRRTYRVLSGSVLAVWERIERQFSAQSSKSNNHRMQVIRLKTTDESKIVGILVPKTRVKNLTTDLRCDAEKFEEKSFTE